MYDNDMMNFNSYDIDGVIYLGPGHIGVYPGPKDIIVTGRSYEEYDETEEMLFSRNINNRVYYNPLKKSEKSRVSSGIHKANIIGSMINYGYTHGVHFEDDEVQIAEIRRLLPNIKIVHLVHDLIEK